MKMLFALVLMFFSTAHAELSRGDAVPPRYHRGILIIEVGAPTIRVLMDQIDYTLKASVLEYPQNKRLDLETMQEVQVYFGDEDVLAVRPLGKEPWPRLDD